MMTIEQMKDRLAEIAMKLRPLMAEQSTLIDQLRRAESKAWIAANGITRRRVHAVDDVGEWVGTVYNFAVWLRQQRPMRPFAEWNGRLYHTTDLLNDRLEETPGFFTDVPEDTNAR